MLLYNHIEEGVNKIMDKEFLQHIKDTGYDDLLDINEENILQYKNTLFYQKWRLEKAWQELAKAMMETKFGSMMLSLVEFLDKCFEKIF